MSGSITVITKTKIMVMIRIESNAGAAAGFVPNEW
jgi:hypothetical protein